jgi:DNA-binding PadR family transcriptional regulator
MIEQEYSEIYDKLVQELRRGLLVLATLSQLAQEKYGYSLIDEFAEQGLKIDQGTLYPLLRRLEADGLLQSEWNTAGSRPRRYYQISSSGKIMLAALIQEWRSLTEVLEKLLTTQDRKEGEKNELD